MIFTERTITVVNDSATINKPLILYRGDKNIELKITIVESKFKFRNTGASNVIETSNASYAQLVINTPYNSPIFSEVTATENGTVIFVISAAMIDEVREVGIYDIQIRLLDDNKQSRVTIPPVSNAIEIREPMAIEDGSPIDSNVVNVAKVNRALTTTSAPLEVFDSQGNYIKKTWGDGDPITDAALNKLEAGIDGVNKKVANNSSQIKEIENYGVRNLSKQVEAITKKIKAIAKQVNSHINSGEFVDMFVMAGQSNMEGQSESYVEYSVPENEAYEYKLLTDALVQVLHPFGEDIEGTSGTLFDQAYLGRSSLSPYFAKTYYDNTRVSPVMVQCAKGASTVSEWLKGTERYTKMVEKVNKAVTCTTRDLNKNIRGKYLVWLQGESDGINNVTKEIYKERFLQLWNDLKIDCNLDKCFIIRVGKFHEYDVYTIMKAQEELAQENEDIIMATRITGYLEYPSQNPEHPTLQDGTSNYYAKDHYTNEGYKLVGETSASNIADYITYDILPILEEEPYDQLKDIIIEPTPVEDIDYKWDFRQGILTEAEEDIRTTVIDTINIENGYITRTNDGTLQIDKVELEEGGIYTISLTMQLVKSGGVGQIITDVDDQTGNKNCIFIYEDKKTFRLLLTDKNWQSSVDCISLDWDLTPMYTDNSICNMNNFTIQKKIDKYELFINGVSQGELSSIKNVFAFDRIMCPNDMPFSSKLAYFRVCSGTKTPQEMDPTFFVNNL